MATRQTTQRRKASNTAKRRAAARKATTATTTLTRRQVVAQLKKGVAQITFRKQDGSNRVLIGTLNQDAVPGTLTETERNGGTTRGVVTVWDVENNGFRSFRLDNLRKIRPQQAQR